MEHVESLINSLCQGGKNVIILGDFNVNVFKENHCLRELFEVTGVRNLVNEATCFKSRIPTCLDLVVTNVYKRIQNVTCFDSGLNDFHHFICFATKLHVPESSKHDIVYRSYKTF